MSTKKYVIGCDNAAVGLKKTLVKFLVENDIEFEDVGVDSEEDDLIYPLVAERVVEKIKESNYQKEGILLCGTGIGMALTANKFPRIFAAVCHDIYSAERARLSNNTNIICLGARIIGPELAKKILQEWLKREFAGGRSLSKVEKIWEIERRNFK